MKGVCLVLCGGASPPAQTKDGSVRGEPLRLDLQGPKPNVLLKIADISEAMVRNVPDALMDLVEIAVYILAADQAAGRGGVRDAGGRWRRRFRFHIPVRCPEIWSSAAVTAALVDLLSFLSDDDYACIFSKLDRPPPTQLYFEQFAPDFDAEEVVLFSGGLDSLGGAIQEAIVEQKNVVLVSHDSASKRKPHITALATEVVRRGTPGAVRHIPVWATKAENVGREYTQRSRSFLYAALAAVVASMLGRNRIRFYENGVTSINLPITPQVVGGRASRTTHPQSLGGFARLLSTVLERPFSVENPFLWKTKGDVVRLIKDNGCTSLIARSVSCSRTVEATKLHTHCGRCSQCIDRRFATLAAGVNDDEDPPEMYKADLLTGERPFGESRTMAESFLQRASRLRSIRELDFFAEYPEATRILRHVGLGTDAAGEKVLDLHRRHADEVFAALTEGHRRHAREFQEGQLPDSCLLALAVPKRYRQAEDAGTPNLPMFRLEGEFWRIWFENERVSLKDNVGLRHIARLLATPGRQWHSADLVAEEAGASDRRPSGSAGEVSGRMAIHAYRRRLSQIEDELVQATNAGDPERQVELREEAEGIRRHLKSVTNLRGKPRGAVDEGERARQAVTAAVRRAMATLSTRHTPLWRHLRKSLKTGVLCCYEADPTVTWVTA